MLGLLAPALVATVLALVWPARERARPHDGVLWWPAAVGAFLCELVLYNPPINSQPWAVQYGPWLWLLTRLVLLAVALRNARSSPPWRLVTLGLALNGAVIAANGGFMPQSAEAAAEVWGNNLVRPAAGDRLDNVTPLTQASNLPWLADVIAQPAWLPRRNVVSVGDIILSLGIAGCAYQITRRRIVRETDTPLYACPPSSAGRRHPALWPRG